MENTIEKTYITFTTEQLENMLANSKVGGVSQIKLEVKYEVLAR